MLRYDHLYSHAQQAIRECREGKYKNEVITYALYLTYYNYKLKRQVERIGIITNESILMVKQLKSLQKHIPLRQIRGMMVYYYDHKEGSRSTVNLELANGNVVKLHTKQP